MTIILEIAGHPTPQGSKRAWVQNGHARMAEQTGDRLRSWRQDVKAAAIAARNGSPISEPVFVTLEFRFPRPKAHYRGGKFSHLLKDNAPAYPTSRSTGDIEKLIRSTHDAITSADLWVDDSLVAAVLASKAFSSADKPAGATVRIEPMEVSS